MVIPGDHLKLPILGLMANWYKNHFTSKILINSCHKELNSFLFKYILIFVKNQKHTKYKSK